MNVAGTETEWALFDSVVVNSRISVEALSVVVVIRQS